MPPEDPPFTERNSEAAIRDLAASWIVRRDRGLSGHEAAEFERWLQENPRHRAAMSRAATVWQMLDGVPAAVPIPAAGPSRQGPAWLRPVVALGGLAAAGTLGFFLFGDRPAAAPVAAGNPSAASAPSVVALAPQTRRLPDGTVVRLNVGAELAEEFSAAERHVRLLRGEAYFEVTSDPARPFIVHARGIAVRAVGTAFGVHLKPGAVDVVVTEGRVRVNSPAEPGRRSAPSSAARGADAGPSLDSAPLVVAGQRAVVTLASPQMEKPVIAVSAIGADEMERTLAWHEPLLRLGGATLAELALEFERQTGRRLILSDPAVGALRVGGRFRSDDLDGFVRVLEENYGIKVERRADGSISLGKGP